MDREKNYSLLLLAGGKNSRMGLNKAELYYGGKTFAQLMLAKGRELGILKNYISGFSLVEEEAQTVWDQYPDRGPLGGIHACMKAMDTPFCLILPVDAPKLPPEILEALVGYHENHRRGLTSGREIPLIWEHGERKEPLIAIYPVTMADTIGKLIEEKPAPVFRLLDQWGYECFTKEMAKDQILNVNTPELYQALLESEENEGE